LFYVSRRQMFPLWNIYENYVAFPEPKSRIQVTAFRLNIPLLCFLGGRSHLGRVRRPGQSGFFIKFIVLARP
jgi:hypothetical protein